MKKLLVVLLALAMVITMVACKKAEEPDTPDTPVTPDEPTTPDEPVDEPVDILVIHLAKTATGDVHSTINAECQKRAQEWIDAGLISEYQLLDGNGDAPTQVSMCETALALGVDYLTCCPTETAGSEPVLTKAMEAGVPIIMINSYTTTSVQNTAVVTVDDVQGGEYLAQWMVDYYKDGGGYIHAQGKMGNSAAQQRTEGLHNVFDGLSNWKMLAELDCEWDATKASNFAQDCAVRYGDELTAMCCDNDNMAVAAQLTLNSLDRKDVLCIGCDGIQSAMAAIKTGELTVDLMQPLEGQVDGAYDLLYDLIANGKMWAPGYVYIPWVYVTADNVDQYYKG